MSLYLMHTALLVKALNWSSNLTARQLFDNLFQLWVALANDVIQRCRPHTAPQFAYLNLDAVACSSGIHTLRDAFRRANPVIWAVYKWKR
jgi:hypothetical protein